MIAPLAAYTICASLGWCRNGEKRTRLSLCLHQALVAHLLIALGSVAENFQLPDNRLPKPAKLIHLLSAFVVVGILESLRQNVWFPQSDPSLGKFAMLTDCAYNYSATTLSPRHFDLFIGDLEWRFVAGPGKTYQPGWPRSSHVTRSCSWLYTPQIGFFRSSGGCLCATLCHTGDSSRCSTRAV